MLEQLLSLDQRLTLLLNGSHSIYWDTFFYDSNLNRSVVASRRSVVVCVDP